MCKTGHFYYSWLKWVSINKKLKEETFEYIVGKDSSTIQVKNEGNPVYRAKKLSQILYSGLKEMQANSIKEKVKPVVYFIIKWKRNSRPF